MKIRDASGRSYNYGPPAATDSFGRSRVSDPVTIFDSQSEYDAQPLLWDTTLTGGGTSAHLPAESAVALAVTTASGDKVVRQTRQYHRYQPGKSQQVLITFVMDAAQANLVQTIGYGDAENGIFFRMNGLTPEIVQRTNTSGSPVDTAVNQASWSQDRFGELDFTKAQIFFVDLEWLGVGIVRAGFVVDGEIRYAHYFLNANNVERVYMRTANLPVRYEIEAADTLSSAATLKAICCSVISEGGFEQDRGFPFSVGTGTGLVAVTTRRPILSIRPKATFGGLVNRATILFIKVSGYAENNATYIELCYGGTLTGASFSSVNASSVTEYDTAATAIASEIPIDTLYIPSGRNVSGSSGIVIATRLPLTLDAAGANPISMTVVATSLNQTADVGASVSWLEFR